MNYNITAHRRGRLAFSLVETVIALGIMALAITALLGLLPHGIEMTRKAANENAYARILNSVRTELMRVPYDSLPTIADGQRLRYDEQGVIISDGSANGNNSQAFLVLVDYQGVLNRNLIHTGGGVMEPQVANFSVHIAETSLSDFNFLNQNTRSYRSYPIHVAANFTTFN